MIQILLPQPFSPSQGMVPGILSHVSKKMSPPECNDNHHDKELLSITCCFEVSRPYLEVTLHHLEVRTDHKILEPFMKMKLLNRKQVIWSEFLSRYEYIVTFCQGTKNAEVDVLTRRSGDFPREMDERLTHHIQTMLKPKNLEILTLIQATVTLEHYASLEI